MFSNIDATKAVWWMIPASDPKQRFLISSCFRIHRFPYKISHLCIYSCVHKRAHVYACAYVCMSVSISVHMSEHECVYGSTLDEHMHVWIHEYMYHDAREHMHVYMLGGKHARAMRSVLTYMSICISMRKNICMYTCSNHLHEHIHIHLCMLR